MQTEFITRFDLLAITPLIAVSETECEDKSCSAKHYQLTLMWMFWTLNVVI